MVLHHAPTLATAPAAPDAGTVAFRSQALVMSEKALGPTHPVTLTCAEGLAEVLLQQVCVGGAGGGRCV